jgi:RNA polymerase sigma factor (sigma-70 family)
MVDGPSRDDAQKTEKEYDALIKRSLGNGRKNFFRDTERLRKRQTPFSEFDDDRIESFADERASDAFALIGSEFRVMKYSVSVRDALLHDALSRIDEQSRSIVLMAYWLEMSDLEISDETGIPRRTVNGIKRRTYDKLREIPEDEGYDASSFFPK